MWRPGWTWIRTNTRKHTRSQKKRHTYKYMYTIMHSHIDPYNDIHSQIKINKEKQQDIFTLICLSYLFSPSLSVSFSLSSLLSLSPQPSFPSPFLYLRLFLSHRGGSASSRRWGSSQLSRASEGKDLLIIYTKTVKAFYAPFWKALWCRTDLLLI